MSSSRPVKRPFSKWKADREVAKIRKLGMVHLRLDDHLNRDPSSSSDDNFGRESPDGQAVIPGCPSPSDDNFGRESPDGQAVNPGCPSPDPDDGGPSSSDNGDSDPSNEDSDSAGGDSDGSSYASEGDANNADALEFHDDTEREAYIIQSLRKWAVGPGILSMRKLDDLLSRLHPLYPNLPLSHKTLLPQVDGLEIFDLPSGGSMWYKSIKANFDAMDLENYVQKFECLSIDVNMDGLPLYKSSKKKFWPILGKLVKSMNEPFIIALYCGDQDPQVVDEYLEDYVFEVKQLMQSGYEVNGVSYPFKINKYICDAPAREFGKCVIGHGGYCSCEKCTVYGEYIDRRVTYMDINAPLRTDDSFRAQAQRQHHHGKSPLQDFTNMVSQFPLENMHLVSLGVFKRLLNFWLRKTGPWKLDRNSVSMISTLLNYLSAFHPGDFNRPPKGLDYFTHYKATEFRRMLLYDGIFVFKDVVKLHVSVKQRQN